MEIDDGVEIELNDCDDTELKVDIDDSEDIVDLLLDELDSDDNVEIELGVEIELCDSDDAEL
ncbi:hypothetical protein CCP1ISM_90039 [Azospirillaceae bacterium]